VLLVYGAVLVVAHVHWHEVLLGCVGVRMSWSWHTVGLLVAILGTTISPYMFFWQSAHRVEQMRADPGPAHQSGPLVQQHGRHAYRRLFLARLDVFVGMLVSTLGMFAIMVATASTIGQHGSRNLNTAADAAAALEPIAGRWAVAIFAIGFVATGVLAVPVLASSGSIALAGMLGKAWGFDRSIRKAPVFYGLIVVGTLGGVATAIMANDPVGLLVFSAIINGICAAPFLVVVVLIASDTAIMGEFANGRLAAVAGWFTTILMGIAAVAGLYVTIGNR